MAFQISFQFPSPNPTKPDSLSKFKPTSLFIKHYKFTKTKPSQFTIKSTQSTNNNNNPKSEQEQEKENPEESNKDITEPTSNIDASDLGSQIKKAMGEREGRERGNFWSGVAEEIREIEWPAFGKVVGTTGVVLGVIAGSSIVLLTVNAVLAELSDRVFAGKGVQDFFG